MQIAFVVQGGCSSPEDSSKDQLFTRSVNYTVSNKQTTDLQLELFCDPIAQVKL